jgi:hypothetical protein
MKSERQKQHLEKIRNIKLNEKKARELEETADTTDDKQFKDRLLKEALRLRNMYRSVIIEEPLTSLQEQQPKQPKQQEQQPDKYEELKREIENLTKQVAYFKESKYEKDEKYDDDTDLILETIQETKEDVIEEMEDLLDEDEADLFELLNALHQLEIQQLREEYETKLLNMEIEDYKKEHRHQSIMKAVNDRSTAIFADKMKNNKDLEKNVNERMRWFSGLCNSNPEEYQQYKLEAVNDEIKKLLK